MMSDGITAGITVRTMVCGCGSEFEQRGVDVAGTPRFWTPLRCAQCQATVDAEAAATEAERREQERRTARALRIRRAREALDIPPLYEGVSVDSFRMHGSAEDRVCQGRVLQLARRYLAAWPEVQSILLLRGGPGTGKGHIAWSLAQGLMEQGVCVAVVKLADLVRELRASWRKAQADSETEVLARYRGMDLLVIDEVSRHAFYGERIHQHLYDVLDYRIERCLPTILTTNEDDSGVEEILRPALVSRLLGNGQIVEFGMADYRALVHEREVA